MSNGIIKKETPPSKGWRLLRGHGLEFPTDTDAPAEVATATTHDVIVALTQDKATVREVVLKLQLGTSSPDRVGFVVIGGTDTPTRQGVKVSIKMEAPISIQIRGTRKRLPSQTLRDTNPQRNLLTTERSTSRLIRGFALIDAVLDAIFQPVRNPVMIFMEVNIPQVSFLSSQMPSEISS